MPKKDVRRGGACQWQWGSKMSQPYVCGNARSRAIAETKIDRRIAAVYASGYKKK